MSSLYRPSTRREAQAAMAKLTAAERAAHEEGNLHMLRASIERTLWHLDPQSELAQHLRETTKEIRRHSLNALLPKQRTPRKPYQQPLPYLEPEADEIPERFSHMRLDQTETKRASTLPPAKPSRYPSRPRQEPIIELSSDASSELSDLSDRLSDINDTPEQLESAATSDESAATRDESAAITDESAPISDMRASTKPESIPAKDPKKRPADIEDDDEASPVTKRVKGWLSHFIRT